MEQCLNCRYLVNGSTNLVKNQMAKIRAKYKIINPVINIIDGRASLEDKDVKKSLKPFFKTSVDYLSERGKVLKIAVKELSDYVEKRIPTNQDGASKFIKEFWHFYNEYPQFEDTMICDLLKNSMYRRQGRMNNHIGPAARDLFMLLYQIKPKSAETVSANLDGPSMRYLMKAQKKDDEKQSELSNILQRNVDDVADAIVKTIEQTYTKEDIICVTLSIDASKLAQLVQIDPRSGKIVGGAAPNHCIDRPEESDDIAAILDSFRGEKPKYKKASEVKVGTMVFQNEKPGTSPYKQLMARPQTKNENSDFNEVCCEAVVKAEKILRAKGYNFSFAGSANDGVSCDSNFVRMGIENFLDGKKDYLCVTDTNHNVKNARYQAIIGGNAVKTIGNCLIDTGMLKLLGINQELYIVKDFASDKSVLELNSSNTVAKILGLEGQDTATQLTLALNLFFMRVHLFAVNCKGKLQPRERVTMLWSSLLFFLHIEGVHPTTKKNWIMECVGLSFLILRSDVCQPHRLTSEPSEHTFAILRNMIREFTVLDFSRLIMKLDRMWLTVMKGKVKIFRNSGGYGATAGSHSEKTGKLPQGPVDVNYESPESNPFLAAGGDSSMVNSIWTELREILNKTSCGMRTFLTNMFGVNSFHRMASEFEDLDNFKEVFNACMKNSKETTNEEHLKGGAEEEQKAGDSMDDDALEDAANPNEEALQDKLEERVIKHIIAVERGRRISEERINEDDENLPFHVLEEDATRKDKTKAWTHFIKIMNMGSKEDLLGKCDLLVNAMNEMNLGKREKGSKDGACRFQTLLGRYFKKEVLRKNKRKREKKEIAVSSKAPLFQLID